MFYSKHKDYARLLDAIFFTMIIPTKFYASTARITSIKSKQEYQIYIRSSSSFEQKGN